MTKVTIFACDRKPSTPCKRCGGRAVIGCEYPLRGEKAGQTCGAPLCEVHSYEVEAPDFKGRVCAPHAKLLNPDLKL